MKFMTSCLENLKVQHVPTLRSPLVMNRFDLWHTVKMPRSPSTSQSPVISSTETTPDSSSLLGPKDLSARHLVQDNEIRRYELDMTHVTIWRELVSIRPSEVWWQPGSLCFARPDLAIVAFKDFAFLHALFCLRYHKPKKRKNITNHLCQSICISETDPFALDAQQCQIYCNI